jgi:hypothetical protein
VDGLESTHTERFFLLPNQVGTLPRPRCREDSVLIESDAGVEAAVYLGNVCVADTAHRRGVAEQLVRAALCAPQCASTLTPTLGSPSERERERERQPGGSQWRPNAWQGRASAHTPSRACEIVR